MSVLFHAPLFGIFEVEENSEEDLAALTKGSKLFIYGIALAAGTGIYAGLSALFGAGLSGFPSFDMVEIQRKDYLLMILYILCGLILAYFYQATHKLTGNISNRFPAVVREIFAGLCLGITGSFLPALMFSGEEQMGTLMKTYTSYLPLALIGIAFFKLLLTNLCIQFGLKGGHFFPVIFAGVCMGYGMAMLTCGPDGGHVVFGAAIVTASLLGGIMKKPLAVTMLLFLCFPVKMFIWIFGWEQTYHTQTRAGTFCKLQQAIESLPDKKNHYIRKHGCMLQATTITSVYNGSFIYNYMLFL